MRHNKFISFKRAERLGFIQDTGHSLEFNKCPYCGSLKIVVDKTKPVYHEECHGWALSECDYVCDNCKSLQGHWAYGSVDPVYVKTPKPNIFKRILLWFRNISVKKTKEGLL